MISKLILYNMMNINNDKMYDFYLGQDGEDSTLIESLYISVFLNVLSFITSTNGIIGIMMRNIFQTLMINFITLDQNTKRKVKRTW